MNAYDTDYEEDQVLTLSMLAELVQHGGDPVLQLDSGNVVPIVARPRVSGNAGRGHVSSASR